MKILFEYITDSYSLLDNPLDDYVIMAIIGMISYVIAYALVNKLYRYDMIDGRGAGHILHWIIRLIVFVIIFYLVATAIRIYVWFRMLPGYKWWIIGGIVFVIMIAKVVYELLRNKRNEVK